MSSVESGTALRGGEWLLRASEATDVFTPEQFTDDQLMVISVFRDFLNTRVLPNAERLEGLDIPLTVELLREMGELGLLGTAFPEEYGGSMQDFVTNILINEVMAPARSFALSFGAHTGIGMMPILYFGTEAQKAKYLPSLIAGTRRAAYCLTEPGSGSDALAAKTTAVLSEDGSHYLLNGQKMWITNAGFADVLVVFAKIDGKHFTGFIVERDWPGVSTGAEEKKMGIKGSSTRQVFFENVRVPAENVLGEPGKGHRIAFNILNIGRIKLGAANMGGAKIVTSYAVRYAAERRQFGRPIGEFGAISFKLAEMAVRTYAVESALYRASMDIQQREHALLAEGKPLGEALLGAAEEYSIECALLKVAGSECLHYAVDEAVQVYGGMGYSEEAPAASAYRDARINRIFEGTNEINRMLVVDMLLKRAMSGKLDLMGAALAVQQELMSPPTMPVGAANELFGAEKRAIADMKKAIIMVLGATVQHFMQALEQEQEILMDISDMLIETYIAESVLLRTEWLVQQHGPEAMATRVDMAKVYLNDAEDRLTLKGKYAICNWATGDTRRTLLAGLKRYTRYEGINVKEARRRIAAHMAQSGGYCF